MKFLDKVKNMFTEEVEDEIRVEPIKKEVTHVAIESPNADDDDFEKKVVDRYEFEDEEEEKEEFKKPIFFDDNDFEDLRLKERTERFEKKEEKIEPEENLYNLKEEKEEKKVFKPTPIISPVYGVLDKNYHKEDIVSRSETKHEKEDTEPSIDSVRDKAYGTLEDELENTLFGKSSILFKKNDSKEEKNDEEVEVEEVEHLSDLNDDLLDSFTSDISRQLDELLEKKEKYVDDEPEDTKEEEKDDGDLLEFIDSTLYKDEEE